MPITSQAEFEEEEEEEEGEIRGMPRRQKPCGWRCLPRMFAESGLSQLSLSAREVGLMDFFEFHGFGLTQSHF